MKTKEQILKSKITPFLGDLIGKSGKTMVYRAMEEYANEKLEEVWRTVLKSKIIHSWKHGDLVQIANIIRALAKSELPELPGDIEKCVKCGSYFTPHLVKPMTICDKCSDSILK